MSDELKLNVSLIFSKGGAQVSKLKNFSFDVTGESFVHGVQEIGTTEEELTQIAELGTPGYVYAVNLDDTNYVEIGSTTGVYDIKLKPGEIAVWRHNSGTVYAKANTAACLVEYIIIED